MEIVEVHRDLEARWEALVEDRERIRSEAESRVAEKAWGSILSSRERPEPLYAERSQLPNGRLSRKRPKSLRGVKEYGFDDRGRVVIKRRGWLNVHE